LKGALELNNSEMCGSSILSQTQILEFTKSNVDHILKQCDKFLKKESAAFDQITVSNLESALKLPLLREKDLTRLTKIEVFVKDFNCDKHDFINS